MKTSEEYGGEIWEVWCCMLPGTCNISTGIDQEKTLHADQGI